MGRVFSQVVQPNCTPARLPGVARTPACPLASKSIGAPFPVPALYRSRLSLAAHRVTARRAGNPDSARTESGPRRTQNRDCCSQTWSPISSPSPSDPFDQARHRGNTGMQYPPAPMSRQIARSRPERRSSRKESARGQPPNAAVQPKDRCEKQQRPSGTAMRFRKPGVPSPINWNKCPENSSSARSSSTATWCFPKPGRKAKEAGDEKYRGNRAAFGRANEADPQQFRIERAAERPSGPIAPGNSRA